MTLPSSTPVPQSSENVGKFSAAVNRIVEDLKHRLLEEHLRAVAAVECEAPAGFPSEIYSSDDSDLQEVHSEGAKVSSQQITQLHPFSSTTIAEKDHRAQNETEQGILTPMSSSVRSISSDSMPPANCAQHEILPVWSFKTQRTGFSVRARTPNALLALPEPELREDALDEGSSYRSRKFCRPMAPSCHISMFWDLLAIIALLYDCFAVPLNLVDLPLVSDSDGILVWTTRLYWSFDIILSFCVGYFLPNGDQVTDMSKIARRYMTTWFIPDMMLLTLDYMSEVLADQERNVGSVSRLTRALRVLRFLRLLRLMRAPKVLRRVLEKIRSEKSILFVNIARSMTLILIIIHALGCAWYSLGVTSGGWVTRLHMVNKNPWLRYTSSFLWALSQFFGSTDIYPKTLSERAYAIGAQIFAFLSVTVFVSDLTSSMTRLHIISCRQSTELAVLRKYMMEKQISIKLAQRITMNASYVLAQRRKAMSENEVELLSLVSEPLIQELRFESHSPALTQHPLFREIFQDTPAVGRKLCSMAVETGCFCEGDQLFSPGEVPLKNRLFFIVSGTLTYTRPVNTSQYDSDNPEVEMDVTTEQISPGAWLCEATLWCHWTYIGLLVADVQSQLLMIGGDDFERILTRSDFKTIDIPLYAEAYVRKLNSDPDGVTELGTSIDSEELIDQVSRMVVTREYAANRKTRGGHGEARGKDPFTDIDWKHCASPRTDRRASISSSLRNSFSMFRPSVTKPRRISVLGHLSGRSMSKCSVPRTSVSRTSSPPLFPELPSCSLSRTTSLPVSVLPSRAAHSAPPPKRQSRRLASVDACVPPRIRKPSVERRENMSIFSAVSNNLVG
eukprot:TRINITY_DN62474_c0_g1_i1.p1 TRINITY_DN62474_c0_g1~~TRINITY_DN62474_c0_g1_i1.p1  ORF type:complete len:845 (-),score=81.82 TRINITY_DN62474_c0_g1_i1:21-2555(-)